MTFNEELLNKSQELLNLALITNAKIAVAESCTAGLISSLITEISGSSQIFDRGFVTYSNLAKQEMLGVSEVTLDKYGAVSSQVAEEMAKGAVNNSIADVSVAVTGIAGPDGGTKEKPVGLVYVSSYNRHNKSFMTAEFNLVGDRSEIRMTTVQIAIDMLIKRL